MMLDKNTKTPKTEAAWKAAAEIGQKQMEAIMEAQKEITACCEQTMRGLADRMKLEVDLASDFTTKLRSAKSVPESVHIYQEWLGNRMKLSADQGQELMGDFQRFLNASARAMPSSAHTKA
jgi:uncharacterized protein (DUF2126 family)